MAERTSTEMLQDIHRLQDKFMKVQSNHGSWNEVSFQMHNLVASLNICDGDDDVFRLKGITDNLDKDIKEKVDKITAEEGELKKELGQMRQKYYDKLKEDSEEKKEVPELSEEDGKPDFEF